MKKWWEAIFADDIGSESESLVLRTHLDGRIPVRDFERPEPFGYEHFLRRLQEPPPLNQQRRQESPRLVYLASQLAEYMLSA